MTFPSIAFHNLQLTVELALPSLKYIHYNHKK